jgi:hydroxyethylthiazole kinase
MDSHDLSGAFVELRKRRPLVHHITNYVTVNDCANITLCFGGAPVMADAIEEVEEMVTMASALVLNIGTLNRAQIESMLMAGREANRLDVPIVLDPVGVGATAYRTKSAQALLDGLDVAVLKGNAGEIGVLAGTGGQVRGVDSVGISGDRRQVAELLAERRGCCVVMSGATDIVTDGKRTLLIDNGHEMMGRVTGTGCMATSIVGSFVSVTKDHLVGAAAAMAAFGIVGERAAQDCSGPGSFRCALFDRAAALMPVDVRDDSRFKVARE